MECRLVSYRLSFQFRDRQHVVEPASTRFDRARHLENLLAFPHIDSAVMGLSLQLLSDGAFPANAAVITCRWLQQVPQQRP